MSTKQFISELKKSLFLNPNEEELFDNIPLKTWDNIFTINFNKDLDLAKNIIWNKFENLGAESLIPEIEGIENFNKSYELIENYIQKKKPILFITDNDNDGSSAQAALLELKEIYPDQNIIVEYWQNMEENPVRGFSKEYVDYATNYLKIPKDEDFLIVTADNGINSNKEAEGIYKNYPKAKLLITDHHLPNEDVVIENDRTIVFDPKYKPTPFFKNKNISGAHTLIALLQEIVKKSNDEKSEQVYNNMQHIANISNQLDYVNTDIRHKPLKEYLITKFSSLGTYMNVNNSTNKIITGEMDFSIIDNLQKNNEGINKDLIKENIQKIKNQNIIAYTILTIIKDYRNNDLDEEEKELVENDFYDLLLERMSKVAKEMKSNINPNFVEQLRPYIINYEGKANKTDFEKAVIDGMTDVFKNLKFLEREIMDEIRKSPIMDIEKTKNSTILTPVNEDVMKIFNRKFLTKTYNEENNGFLLISEYLNPNRMIGSMRSIYPIQDILKNRHIFEKKYGITLKSVGHDVAAGFFIEKETQDITQKTLTALNQFISNEVEKIKKREAKNAPEYIEASIDSLDLIDKINKKIKAHLPGCQPIEPLLKLTKQTFITDNETTDQKQIYDLVKDKNYGYKPIPINFDNKAAILPVEMIKQIVKEGYEDYIQLGYMDEGAFMGKAIKTKSMINPKKLISLKMGDQQRRDLEEYYQRHYTEDNDYTVQIDEEMIKKVPYFSNNSYSEKEFNRFKQMVIDVIEKSNVDTLSIIDTEGTGLGQAPKLFNIGAMNLMIDDENTTILNINEVEKLGFTDFKNSMFIINEKDVNKLESLSNKDYDNLSFKEKTKLIKNTHNQFFKVNKKILNNSLTVNNMSVKDDGNCYINRKLKADVMSFLINHNDIKLTQEIINLTGIDNKMLKTIGMKVEEVDNRWHDYFKNKKAIFQAHNLPYDNGIINTNMPKASELLRSSLLSDSAQYARSMKLAYDDIEVAKIMDVPELKGLEFYDSPYSDYNFQKFLLDPTLKSYPDRTGNKVLKKNKDKVRLIDKKNNYEIELDETIDELKQKLVIDEMNGQSIKYSVEQLSLHETVRNMLLSQLDLEKDVKKLNIPKEWNIQEDVIEFFMEQYHWDSSKSKNVNNFYQTLQEINDTQSIDFFMDKENREEFISFVEDFVETNKSIQGKFQNAWIYKKVLSLYEPHDKDYDTTIIEHLSYETNFPKGLIKQVLDEAVEYKKKMKIDHIVVHEAHNNIIFDQEGYGDVILEGVLTMKRLVDREYNSYSRKSGESFEIFRENMNDTKKKSLMRDIGDVAIDQYSRKQAQNYRRKVQTDQIRDMKKPDMIKFKLGQKILPPKTFVEVSNSNKRLTKKIQSELENKIKFVMTHEMIKSSLNSNTIMKNIRSKDTYNSVIDMIQKNELQITEDKKFIRKHLGDEVLFSRKINEIKKITDEIALIGRYGTMPKKVKLNAPLSDKDLIDIETFIDGLQNHYDISEQVFQEDLVSDYMDRLSNVNKKLKEEELEIKELEKELEGKDIHNIIPTVNAFKIKIGKWIYQNGNDFMNKTLYEVQKELEQKEKFVNKKRIKKAPKM